MLCAESTLQTGYSPVAGGQHSFPVTDTDRSCRSLRRNARQAQISTGKDLDTRILHSMPFPQSGCFLGEDGQNIFEHTCRGDSVSPALI